MIEIYTDGSCWPNPSADGSWAFVVYKDGKEIYAASGRAEGLTTGNRMELTAMLRALMWLGDRPGRLYSDSRYVVDGINLWCPAWIRRGWQRVDKATKKLQPVMNADLWQVMAIARQRQHSISWVKGHAGIVGNERADQLAEIARERVVPC
jgi:ribonuclease HI